MRLKAVARYFDKEKVYDAYTLAYLFNAQTSSFDDHSSSGATARRRVMSARDGTVAPARQAVSILDELWLVGASNPDGWKGGIIRLNFNLKKVTSSMQKGTPAQACLNTMGTPFYTQKGYFKDTVNTVTEAEYDTQWNVFCPPVEDVKKGDFLKEGSTFYRVRTAYSTVEGFTIAEADEFDADAYQVATFTQTGGFDLVTDEKTETHFTTNVLQIDPTKFYKLASEAEDLIKAGDRTVFVAKSVITPTIGTIIFFLKEEWRTLSVTSEQDAWALHVRRA